MQKYKKPIITHTCKVLVAMVLMFSLAASITFFAAPEKASATDASQVSISTQSSTGIVSVSIADPSLSGKDISIICYKPGWNGNTSDWKGNSDMIAYLNQVTLGSDLKYNFVINKASQTGNYSLVLGTPSGKVAKTFSFAANNVTVLPDGLVKNVTAEQIKPTQVKVTWSAVAGTDKYKVFRSTKADSDYTKIGTTEKTEYTDKKVKAGKTYYYKVTADGKNYSDHVSVKLMKTPSVTIKAKAAKKKKGSAILTWKKDTAAAGYKVYMATSKNGKFKAKSTLKKNSKVKATIKKLKKNKTYFFKVRAYKKTSAGTVYSKYSAVKSVYIR